MPALIPADVIGPLGHSLLENESNDDSVKSANLPVATLPVSRHWVNPLFGTGTSFAVTSGNDF